MTCGTVQEHASIAYNYSVEVAATVHAHSKDGLELASKHYETASKQAEEHYEKASVVPIPLQRLAPETSA